MGAVLTATHVVVIELDTESVRTLLEPALSILLFAMRQEQIAGRREASCACQRSSRCRWSTPPSNARLHSRWNAGA
jgi:hypothetical protein